MTKQSVLDRNNVRDTGIGDTPIIFAHGYGCDQNMWRYVAPSFEDEYRTILFDHVGAGGSDLGAYSRQRYNSLHRYADDVLEIIQALDLEDTIFVGHSVSAMIGILAANKAPELFSKLVLLGPSPRYIDDEDYVGGFAKEQIEEMLDILAQNHLGWSANMAPLIMGNSDRPELGEELTNSFCRTDPEIALDFARVTFLSDNRADLSQTDIETLILQCRDDMIAPLSVGQFIHQKMQNSRLVVLEATGHCPNLSAPNEVVTAMLEFLDG